MTDAPASAAPQPDGKPAAAPPGPPPAVAVVGGGVAGMSAALKLAKRGYRVTLFEAREELGGNIASPHVDAAGQRQDVYPHIFAAWYLNFWSVLEDDLGLKREDLFAPQNGVSVINNPGKLTEVPIDQELPPADLAAGAPHEQPRPLELTSATDVASALANLNSRVLSVPDMFLFGFSMLDLAGHPRVGAEQGMINRLDVNGFLYSRGYSNDRVARLQDFILKVIWSIPSTQTATVAYQDLIKHTLRFPWYTPFAWLLKGRLHDLVVEPWATALGAAGCDVRTSTLVEQVYLDGPGVKVVPAGAAAPQAFDYAVLAVTPEALGEMILTGEPGSRIIDRVPELGLVRHASAEAIPVASVVFTGKLTDIPSEIVGLRDSTYDLSVIDISQLWTQGLPKEGVTVLVVAASSPQAIPSNRPKEQVWLMLDMLRRYLPQVKPGARWGDDSEDCNIDWARTTYRSNERHTLYLNDNGGPDWRAKSEYIDHGLTNVAFAGDIVKSDVNMATVEAAVQTGIMAARVIWDQHPLGDEIELARHEIYNDTALLSAKLALLPAAYVAAAWANVLAAIRQREHPDPNDQPQLTYNLILPPVFVLDWIKTAYWLLGSLQPAMQAKAMGAPNSEDDPREADLPLPPGQAIAVTLGQLIVEAGRLAGDWGARPSAAPPGAPQPSAQKSAAPRAAAPSHVRPNLAEAAADFVIAASCVAGEALGALRSAYDQARAGASATAARPPAAGPYQRRWRVKS